MKLKEIAQGVAEFAKLGMDHLQMPTDQDREDLVRSRGETFGGALHSELEMDTILTRAGCLVFVTGCGVVTFLILASGK